MFVATDNKTGALDKANRALANAGAEEIIAWALHTFGSKICLTTSFADTVLVDLVSTVEPDTAVVFLDTGFHFAETLATMRKAHARYRLNLKVIRPDHNAADVWTRGSHACCSARKVAPLDAALTHYGFEALFSGLRRADGPSRANTQPLMVDRMGRIKVNPLVGWSDDDVADYIASRELDINPLLNNGYSSIGCWPCTEPSASGRNGRWPDETKTECGLHQ